MKANTFSNTFFGGIYRNNLINKKHNFERSLVKKLLVRFKIYNISIKQLECFWLTDLGIQLQEVWFPLISSNDKTYLRRGESQIKTPIVITSTLNIYNVKQLYTIYKISTLYLMFVI